MATKSFSETAFTKAFDAMMNADDCITADQLRDLIEKLTDVSIDSKTVRARLRKISARDQSKLHGARWQINRTLAQSEVEHRFKRLAS